MGFNYDGMRLHDNSLELETYLSLNNHKKKKLSLTNSENNSSKKSITNSNSNKKNINKKNLVDEGNNTDNNLIEEDKEIDKDKEIIFDIKIRKFYFSYILDQNRKGRTKVEMVRKNGIQ